MDLNNTPKTTDERLAALADCDLDLRDQPDALTQRAQSGSAIARYQQFKQACARAIDGPEMKCPDQLASKLQAIADCTVVLTMCQCPIWPVSVCRHDSAKTCRSWCPRSCFKQG